MGFVHFEENRGKQTQKPQSSVQITFCSTTS